MTAVVDAHMYDRAVHSVDLMTCKCAGLIVTKFENGPAKPSLEKTIEIEPLIEYLVNEKKAVVFEFVLPLFLVDVRLLFLRHMIVPMLEMVDAPILFRHRDDTELRACCAGGPKTCHDLDFTELLLRVRPVPYSHDWAWAESRLYSLCCTDEAALSRRIMVRTSLLDVLLTSCLLKRRIFWNGFSNSVGYADNLLAFSRLTSFATHELKDLVERMNLFVSLGRFAHSRFIMSSGDGSTSLTLDIDARLDKTLVEKSTPSCTRRMFKRITHQGLAAHLLLTGLPLKYVLIRYKPLNNVLILLALRTIVQPFMKLVTGRVCMSVDDDAKGREAVALITVPDSAELELMTKSIECHAFKPGYENSLPMYTLLKPEHKTTRKHGKRRKDSLLKTLPGIPATKL
jgi:hypothetical protein